MFGVPWRLVWRYLLSHPLRSALTAGSLFVATFLLCVLQSLLGSLDIGVVGAAANRLIVQSKVSLFVYLPESYHSKIESVEGVDLVSKWTWFGGYYQDPGNFFAQFGVEPERFLDAYPEVEMIDGDAESFTSRRTACVIGQALAERFDWSVGDTVPITGQIFPRTNGEPWEFEVAGIYRATSPSLDEMTLFFHHDYLDETRESGGTQGPDGVGVYVVRIEPGTDPTRVMADVDALFENGPQVVQTTTEAEFNRQFVTMLGNVPVLLRSIGGGVLFAILLAAANTMVMAGRERTHHLGILKALGFGDGTAFALLLGESLLLCLVGGGAGLALAIVSEAGFAQALAGMFPGYHVGTDVVALGLGVTLGVGLVAGIVPAWNAMRLEPVRALRAEG